jgi:hypothetical protein
MLRLITTALVLSTGLLLALSPEVSARGLRGCGCRQSCDVCYEIPCRATWFCYCCVNGDYVSNGSAHDPGAAGDLCGACGSLGGNENACLVSQNGSLGSGTHSCNAYGEPCDCPQAACAMPCSWWWGLYCWDSCTHRFVLFAFSHSFRLVWDHRGACGGAWAIRPVHIPHGPCGPCCGN